MRARERRSWSRMRRPAALALSIFLASACSGAEAPPAPAAPRSAFTAAPSAAVTTAPAPSASAAPEAPLVSPDAASPEDAERVLFLATDLRTDQIRKDCPADLEREARIKCLIALRYEDDRDSQKLALTLYRETGSLAGLLPEGTTDDGRNGKVRLLPARPIGLNRDHLTWI